MRIFVYGRLPERWRERFEAFFDVKWWDWAKEGRFLTDEELLEYIGDREIIVLESAPLSAAVIENSKSLKVIAVCKGTPSNIDVKAATQRGIIVFNTPARNADAVADLTVGLIIMSARSIVPALQSVIQGDWYRRGPLWAYLAFQGFELKGRVVGIIGFGAIGRRVARRLKGFGMDILVYDPFIAPEMIEAFQANPCSLAELLQTADFVTLHVPVTEQTKGMIGDEEFSLMKRSAYLINTSRAVVVQRDSLLRALECGLIAGAALDVHYQEPLGPNDPLLRMPNVICLPHIGGATRDVLDRQLSMVLTSLLKIKKGLKPDHIVNPEVFSERTTS